MDRGICDTCAHLSPAGHHHPMDPDPGDDCRVMAQLPDDDPEYGAPGHPCPLWQVAVGSCHTCALAPRGGDRCPRPPIPYIPDQDDEHYCDILADAMIGGESECDEWCRAGTDAPAANE